MKIRSLVATIFLLLLAWFSPSTARAGADFDAVKVLAEQGDAKAQFKLGRMYASGDGVSQDDAESVKWLLRAAEKGNAMAQVALGGAYRFGRGVTQDFAEGARWSRKAAEQGNPDGQFQLGYAYSTGQGVPLDYVQAHKWLNLAAAKGNTDAAQYRGQVAGSMTPEQIAEAEKLKREWKPTANLDGRN